MQTTNTQRDSDPAIPADITTDLFRRRLGAVQVDVIVVGLLCLLLFFFAGVFFQNENRLWKPTLGLLTLITIIEMFTGMTLGKWLNGVTLRKVDGTRPSIVVFIGRGLVRAVPIAIFVLTIFVRAQPLNGILFFVAFVVASCYVSLCYILVMRRGMTFFDAVTGTRLVRTNQP